MNVNRILVLSFVTPLLCLLFSPSTAQAFNDPVTGRWIQRDPLGYVQGPNLYTYLRNNPSTFHDSEGLAAATAVGGGIGTGGYIQQAIGPALATILLAKAEHDTGLLAKGIQDLSRGLKDIAEVLTAGAATAEASKKIADANKTLAEATALLAVFKSAQDLIDRQLSGPRGDALIRRFGLKTIDQCLKSKQCLCAALRAATSIAQNDAKNKETAANNPKKCKTPAISEKKKNRLGRCC